MAVAALIAAAAAVDALDGRFFCERSLAADFDEGRAHKTLPAGEDVARQRRFGFGEIAQAFQDSLRKLRLAACELRQSLVLRVHELRLPEDMCKPDGVYSAALTLESVATAFASGGFASHARTAGAQPLPSTFSAGAGARADGER